MKNRGDKRKMKRDCNTCICKEGSCYPSTTIFDKNKTCKSYSPDYEGYIAELEAQIEKMKCGQNCKHSYLYQENRKCRKMMIYVK